MHFHQEVEFYWEIPFPNITSYVVGLNLSILRFGAHLNSLISGKRDVWSYEFDSGDEQLSIIQGYNHAKRYNY